MKCAICNERKPRRHCPGVSGDICSICCGNERERSILCPSDCEYLREARRHERRVGITLENLPNSDLQVTEEFLYEHRELMALFGAAILAAAQGVEGALDSDALEAIDGLLQSLRTLQNGLYYERLPDNPIARAIQRDMRAALKSIEARPDAPPILSAHVIGMLVFFQRVGLNCNNGRPKCRAFIDFLRDGLALEPPPLELPPLIVTP